MLAVTGRIEAVQTVMVSPQFAGRITEIVRHEGDRVMRGEILARLADSSARSNLLQQEAALSSRQHDLAQARRDLARTSSLVANGAVAAADLESARLLVSRAMDDVRRLSAVMREGQAQLVLLAPFDGTIIRRDGELGQVVGPQIAVFEIATVDAARVSAEVDERYVRALRPGMRAEILPVGSDDSGLPATVSYVAQAVDPQTGAGTVRFAYEHAPTHVLVGMSVDVNISVDALSSAVTIPRESVGGGGVRPFVLIVTDGLVARRNVTIDDWPAPLVVVRSGLEPGDRILVDPTGAAVGGRVRTQVKPDAL
jgi:RND family efflux transporter MFP subunit